MNRILTDVWEYPSDLALRRRLFVEEVFAHPAKMHLGLLRHLIEAYTDVGDTLLDPMAGSGSLLLGAYLERNVILREWQPEYVDMIRASAEKTRRAAGMFCGLIDIAQADAKTLTCPSTEHIIFSPPYGFETATLGAWERRLERLQQMTHDQRWYRKFKNRTAHNFHYDGGSANTGNKSGASYWTDMRLIYRRCGELLSSGGLLILVLKNHYRRGVLRDVVGQTVVEVESLGLPLVRRQQRSINHPSLWQRRRKEAGQPIVEVEDVLVFEKVRS